MRNLARPTPRGRNLQAREALFKNPTVIRFASVLIMPPKHRQPPPSTLQCSAKCMHLTTFAGASAYYDSNIALLSIFRLGGNVSKKPCVCT